MGLVPFCDPFGDDSTAYRMKSQPTVRFVNGSGRCQSCGLYVNVIDASPGLFDVARDDEEGKDE